MSDQLLNQAALDRVANHDAWLTGILGRTAYTLDIKRLELNGWQVLDKVLEEAHSDLFLYVKTPADNIEASRRLQQRRLYLVDTNVVLDRPIMHQPAAAPVPVTIRYSVTEDCDGVMDVARRNFRYTRFHLDPKISRETANTVKAEWAGNYFAGRRGDAMVVAVSGSRVVGFLQLLHAGVSDLVIDLIAVDSCFQGQGIAGAMILFAENQTSRSRYLVGTQVANTPSLRLYEKLGFRVCKAMYVWHGHFPRRSAG